MFALPTTQLATTQLAIQPLPAWQAANGHAYGLLEGGLSALFLSDSSALRPEGHT